MNEVGKIFQGISEKIFMKIQLRVKIKNFLEKLSKILSENYEKLQVKFKRNLKKIKILNTILIKSGEHFKEVLRKFLFSFGQIKSKIQKKIFYFSFMWQLLILVVS